MRLTRLYVATALANGSLLELPADSGAHIARVLRGRPGDPVVLFNGSGEDFSAVIDTVRGNRVSVLVGAPSRVDNESPLDITLLQSVARGDRMDFVVQKATELGAMRVIPVLSRRSVVRLDDEQAASKQAHWQAVAAAACEQCGRSRIPTVDTPAPLITVLGGLSGEQLRLVFEVPEAAAPALLAPQRRPGRAVIVAIGPEGGFDAEELEAFALTGFTRCALGPRILRTETAALAALVCLQTLMGDLSVLSDESLLPPDS